MSTRLRSAGCLVASLLLVLVVAACGIPKDAEPRLIADEPGLSPTSSPSTNDASGSGTVSVFFIDTKADEPVLEERDRPTSQEEGPIEAVNQLLVSGITPIEESEGLISRIPSGTELRTESSSVADGVVTLDLTAEIADIAGPNAVQAYGQLVYTATQFTKVALKVRFLIEGEPDNVPTLDAGDRAVVSRRNYDDLKPKNP
jgi:spore germination protein GerM